MEKLAFIPMAQAQRFVSNDDVFVSNLALTFSHTCSASPGCIFTNMVLP